MMVTSLIAIVAPRTGKIVKNGHRVFCILYTLCLDSVNRRKSRWKFRISAGENQTFLKGVWYLKGYEFYTNCF